MGDYELTDKFKIVQIDDAVFIVKRLYYMPGLLWGKTEEWGALHDKKNLFSNSLLEFTAEKEAQDFIDEKLRKEKTYPIEKDYPNGNNTSI